MLPSFQVGKLSTGDSLDMCSEDEEAILSNDATIKDMEVCTSSQAISSV